MDSNRWKQVDSILQQVLDLPEGNRDDFLRQASANDEELEREVRSLLASFNAAGDFLETPPTPHAPFTGQTISQYRILELLGTGGMGVVYKAFDTRLARLAALKFLPPELGHLPDLKLRLTEEARAASALNHPNISVIYEISETAAGHLFIAMAFHEGLTLREVIAQNPEGMPLAQTLSIASQIACGLACAHQHSILHRDIKPGNIILGQDGIVRIIDFGLAKSLGSSATLDGNTRGTPLYMSPEQASGKLLDCRTDLWSLGAVVYEMLSGHPPFQGETNLQVMHAVVTSAPASLPHLPPRIQTFLIRSLEKDPANRYRSAGDMVRDLSPAPAPPPNKRSRLAAYAILALLVVSALAWQYRRSEKQHWAREQAVPNISRLIAANRPVAAYLLAEKAREYLPSDPQLLHLSESLTHTVSIRSSPPGAQVEVKDYLSPDDPWLPLGKTPLEKTKIPTGYLRWRISKSGMAESLVAPITEDIHGQLPEFNFTLQPPATIPTGMVFVPATRYEDYIWSLGALGPYDLPAFYMDRYEVTNRQFQDFVDQGGYNKPEFWKERFTREDRELTRLEAMDLFRDSTGRPGPATWSAAHFPEGQATLPVSGVSYYEAAAYAEFAGKSLPALSQWYLAAPSPIAKYITQQSNFGPLGPAPAGKFQGLGPLGTFDMAGNVEEWCRNEAGNHARYAQGGAWNLTTANYWEPGLLSPFTRSAATGFRCVRNTAALPAGALTEKRPQYRDFSKVKPASDQAFKI